MHGNQAVIGEHYCPMTDVPVWSFYEILHAWRKETEIGKKKKIIVLQRWRTVHIHAGSLCFQISDLSRNLSKLGANEYRILYGW